MRLLKKLWSPDGRYLILLLIAPLLLLWRWVIAGEVLYWGTLLTQFWPWHTLVKASLLRGEWPLWNPWLGNGTPLLANLQSAVFYPPNLVALLLPVEQFLTFSVVLHLALAGILMYAYTRYLGLEPAAAAVSGLSYALGGVIVGRTQFVPMIHTAAWLPLLLLLGDRLARRPNLPHGLLLAAAITLQFLAGHAQLWFYSLLLLGGYVLFRSWFASRSQRATLLALGRLALAVLLALLLAAVQILPTAELVSHSPRGTGAERYAALTYSFWPWRLITLLAPNFFGNPAWGNYWGYANYWEDHAYMGVLPLLLALAAVWRWLRRQPEIGTKMLAGVVPFFALTIPVSLLLALGWNTPVYRLIFDYVPGFSFFRAPARLLLWYAVAISVLAGVGLQEFEITAKNRRHWQRLLASCLALVLAGFLGGLILKGRSLTFVSATIWAGLLLVLSVILLLLKPGENRSGPLNRRNWQGLVVLFVTVDLLLAGWPLVPTLSPAVFSRPIASAKFLAGQTDYPRFFVDADFSYRATFDQYFQFEDFGPRDTAYWQQFKETLSPNFGVYAGLPTANNNDPLVIGRWQQLVSALSKPGWPQREQLLAATGVQFYVDAENRSGWPGVYQTGTISIQAVPQARPRAYFVPTAHRVDSVPVAIEALRRPDFDSRQEVVIISKDLKAENPAGPEIIRDVPVTINVAQDQQLVLSVDAPQAGFVVLTDTFYPGWQASVDDAPAVIWPANVAFRAVAVPAGPHRVKFWYRPQSFIVGAWISVLTVGATLLAGLVAYRRAGSS